MDKEKSNRIHSNAGFLCLQVTFRLAFSNPEDSLQEFLNLQSWQGGDLQQEETSPPAWKGCSGVLGWRCFADTKRAFLSVLFPNTRWREAAVQQVLRPAFSRTSIQGISGNNSFLLA